MPNPGGSCRVPVFRGRSVMRRLSRARIALVEPLWCPRALGRPFLITRRHRAQHMPVTCTGRGPA